MPVQGGALPDRPEPSTIQGGSIEVDAGGRAIEDQVSGPSGRPAGWLGRPIRARPILDRISRDRVNWILGFGIAARLSGYLSDRGYWLDESSLVEAIKHLDPRHPLGPLGYSQLAPPGFLAAEWLAWRTMGDWQAAFRLVPLLGGLGSLVAFRELAWRSIPPRAAWMALAMFACSQDLIYFSSEVKQYSTDVLCALLGTLLGATVGSRPLKGRAAATLIGAGLALAWWSHPAIFILAGVGTVGLAADLADRRWRSCGLWALVGLAWVANFGLIHALAMRHLGPDRAMWSFWAFAFPPWPFRSAWDATWPARRLMLMLVEPLSFGSPLRPGLSMLPALGCGLIGSARMVTRNPRRFALLALPFGFAMAAAYLRLYPFHGRLVLFLAPSLLLAVASGLDRVGEARARGWLFAALAAWTLGIPAVEAAYRVADPRTRWTSNPIGDNREPPIDPVRFPL